jgi:hypothetical protein
MKAKHDQAGPTPRASAGHCTRGERGCKDCAVQHDGHVVVQEAAARLALRERQWPPECALRESERLTGREGDRRRRPPEAGEQRLDAGRVLASFPEPREAADLSLKLGNGRRERCREQKGVAQVCVMHTDPRNANSDSGIRKL